MNQLETIAKYLSSVQNELLLTDHETIRSIVDYLREIKKKGSTVWLIGNGGSAATASHFANDLRKAAMIPAISLPDLTPTITAYGNDDGWPNMYSHPLHLFMKPNDCLVAISCSGKSANICQAALDMTPERLVIFTGIISKYNRLANIRSSGMISVSDPDIKVQEDVHLAICHAIVGALCGREV